MQIRRRTRWRPRLAVALGLALGAACRSSVEPESQVAAPLFAARDLTADFDVRDDLSVTLWAQSPDLYNPTAIDVDARGRIWVTEAVNYRQWRGRNPGRTHSAGDRVVVLEDQDGDGTCERSTVFAQSPDLVSPLGIAVVGERVYVSCSPSIFVYTDADADLVPEKRETFLTGFGGKNHDHGVHSLVVGPDGRFWLAVGNAGPHIVTDAAGWTVRAGSIYRDGGEHESDNAPNLASDDGRIWVGGLVLRVEPDGTGLEVFAHNFRNEYEVALDAFGNAFTADNDDDGNQACRTAFVVEGGDCGYTSAGGSRTWMADRRPGQSVQSAHWHQDDPGVMPAGKIHGAGGPTGVCVYEGDLFGPELDGAVLDADAGRNCVFVHRPLASGAGFDFAESTLIASRSAGGRGREGGDGEDERARWFRPSDVAIGPDGAIFVADWYDPGVGGHLAGDVQAYGRILRIAPRARRTETPELDLATIEGCIAALESPAVHVRARAASALRTRGDEARPALESVLLNGTRRMQARALWLLADGGQAGWQTIVRARERFDENLLVTLVRASRSKEVRAAFTSGTRRKIDPDAVDDPREIGARRAAGMLRLLAGLAEHPSAAVRREVALALRGAPIVSDALGARVDVDRPATAASARHDERELLLALARAYASDERGGDRTYLEVLGQACTGEESFVFAALRAHESEVLGLDDPTRWRTPFADLAWRLHPAGALPDFGARARSTALSPLERRQAADAIAFMPGRSAAEAMLDLALSGPEDVRETALAWIENRDTNLWRDFHVADQLAPSGIDAAETRWRSGVITHGSVEVDVDVRGARRIWLVATTGELGEGHDWCDWIAPRLVGPAGEFALAEAAWEHAEAGWGEVRRNANAVGGPLSIDGTTFPDGIGTHAYSEIAFAIPHGYERFRATAGIDDGGARQPGARPDVEFALLADAPRDREAFRALAAVLCDEHAEVSAIEAAAAELASEREGGLELVRLAAAKKLSARANVAISALIFECPDLAVRALASEHFVHPDSKSAKPSADEIAALSGDPRRGQELFFGAVASCSACHAFHGRGGDVGPDLTALRSKYARAEIQDAILNPSRAIAFGYDAWTIETEDGLFHSGFVLSEGLDLVLRDTAGRRRVIPTEEIVARTKQRTSTMPDDVALGLESQGIADVVAFLSSDPSAPGRRLATRELFNGRDLAGWEAHLSDPEARAEDVWSVADGVLRSAGNPIGYLYTVEDFTSFVLELDWRFDPKLGAGNSGVLLRVVGEHKVWPKSIEAQLQSRSAGDIWNIDAFAMEPDVARTQGRRTEKQAPCNERPIGEWNHYRITLDGGELVLEVNGAVQNRARWCAEVPGKVGLQSEGAVIEFRNIRITPIERTPPGR